MSEPNTQGQDGKGPAIRRLISAKYVSDVAKLGQLKGLAAIRREQLDELQLAQHLATAFSEARHKRDKYFDPSLFGEPAWDMLLALFARDAVQREWRPTKEVLSFANASVSTAGRWVGVLIEEGLLERRIAEEDERFRFLRLTDYGVELMYDYLCETTAGYSAIIERFIGFVDGET